jgi:hypothetical protein
MEVAEPIERRLSHLKVSEARPQISQFGCQL